MTGEAEARGKNKGHGSVTLVHNDTSHTEEEASGGGVGRWQTQILAINQQSETRYRRGAGENWGGGEVGETRQFQIQKRELAKHVKVSQGKIGSG